MKLVVDRQHPATPKQPASLDGAVERQLVANAMFLLPLAGAGVVIETAGRAAVCAANSEQVRQLTARQLGEDSPCSRALRAGLPAVSDCFPGSADFGYESSCALPLRLDGEQVGVLCLFFTEAHTATPADVAVGQALADAAAIGIVQQRSLSQTELVNQQLQQALNSRVIIEQAKGILAERESIPMSQAFELLRSHARRTRRRLADLARGVVEGEDTTAIVRRHPVTSLSPCPHTSHPG